MADDDDDSSGTGGNEIWHKIILKQIATNNAETKALIAEMKGTQNSIDRDLRTLQLQIAAMGSIDRLKEKVEELEAFRQANGGQKERLDELIAFKNRWLGVILGCNALFGMGVVAYEMLYKK